MGLYAYFNSPVAIKAERANSKNKFFMLNILL